MSTTHCQQASTAIICKHGKMAASCTYVPEFSDEVLAAQAAWELQRVSLVCIHGKLRSNCSLCKS